MYVMTLVANLRNACTTTIYYYTLPGEVCLSIKRNRNDKEKCNGFSLSNSKVNTGTPMITTNERIC